MLHCGDLTQDGTPESISSALEALGKIKAKLKLVIAGNHEISLDKPYWLSQGGTEADVERSYALISPEKKFRGNIYASPYTPSYGASAFQYLSGEDRFNPPGVTATWAKNVSTQTSIIPSGVDIVMTHGPSKYILDRAGDVSAGCEHLRRAVARAHPRLHCFGHIHSQRCGFYEAYRVEFNDQKELGVEAGSTSPILKDWVGENQALRRGFRSLAPNAAEGFRNNKQQTLCINAAMEGEEGVLEHPPWLVKLHLPVKQET
ncbi:hypothetical protein A1F94_010803 [Pyrenophora tritici-repentis]|uniref:Calcineurin-like phosphoesterase domain-containing protein n=1 Tax=Pyrenophora tritici-repentis TaxID=45151 RepID=A0A2W1F7D8_9PLEO|nr:hypothetical protein A1F99_113500 [Pyrenophora tritici-repentis]KAG9379034.1 hypothetical protein A1F94_010803 [Pyrenophora tritici-repentis]KAI1511349.1 hypothetical protein Ptr86124_009753 [Pyrenophora tritici-repentis]KAI1550772.1 Metallophos domain containing protein [Pyrenophora tritici-repentis]KAI1667422.1 hypothetical protein L13192_08131 [Pyrenophora tritici-repentis]